MGSGALLERIAAKVMPSPEEAIRPLLALIMHTKSIPCSAEKPFSHHELLAHLWKASGPDNVFARSLELCQFCCFSPSKLLAILLHTTTSKSPCSRIQEFEQLHKKFPTGQKSPSWSSCPVRQPALQHGCLVSLGQMTAAA